MRAIEFITGHVTFKLRYNQIYQMKTTNVQSNKDKGRKVPSLMPIRTKADLGGFVSLEFLLFWVTNILM